MPQPLFTLSAFGDEIAEDLDAQLDLLASEGIRHMELRNAWGIGVLDLDEAHLARVGERLRERGFAISAIGSPIGKSSLDLPRTFEQERLRRAISVGQALGTRLIRIFSFYVPAGAAAAHRDEVLARIGALVEQAAAAGMTLLHENERGIYGDTPERCSDLLATIDAPALRMAFDPANFVQVGTRPMAEAWPLLGDYTTHVHIKDAVFATGEVRPAGEGDGAIPELIRTLAARGYHGFLTLEPHLAVAGAAGGFSGPAGMQRAVRALRRQLDALDA